LANGSWHFLIVSRGMSRIAIVKNPSAAPDRHLDSDECSPRYIFRGRVKRKNKLHRVRASRSTLGRCQDPEKGEAGFLERLKIARALSRK